MTDLLLSAQAVLQAQTVKFEADVLRYSNEINLVLGNASGDLNKQRMFLGKTFIAALKKEMQHGLAKAGIFGSVSRNEAKESSDVDVALFIKPLTRQEKQEHNSHAAQLERGYGLYTVLNSAYNSHRISELEKIFTEKTNIPVRCMVYEYNVEDFEQIKKEIKFITILE